jgi:hypothetical protein
MASYSDSALDVTSKKQKPQKQLLMEKPKKGPKRETIKEAKAKKQTKAQKNKNLARKVVSNSYRVAENEKDIADIKKQLNLADRKKEPCLHCEKAARAERKGRTVNPCRGRYDYDCKVKKEQDAVREQTRKVRTKENRAKEKEKKKEKRAKAKKILEYSTSSSGNSLE